MMFIQTLFFRVEVKLFIIHIVIINTTDSFHPVELFGNKFIKQKIQYIHNNPVVQ